MRGCGISTIMSTKSSWNKFNRVPIDTFRWRGIDDADVLTHIITVTDQPLKPPPDAQSYIYVGK